MAAVAAFLMMAVIPAKADDQPGASENDHKYRHASDTRVNSGSNGSSNNGGSVKQSSDAPGHPEHPTTSNDDDLSPLSDKTGQSPMGDTLPQNTTTQAPNFDIRQIPEPATLLLTGSAFLFLARKLRK
jgi:hypothetical protein